MIQILKDLKMREKKQCQRVICPWDQCSERLATFQDVAIDTNPLRMNDSDRQKKMEEDRDIDTQTLEVEEEGRGKQ